MVYYSGDPPEKRLQVYFSYGKAVGFVVRECHACPSTRYDCTAADRARGLDDRLAHVLWSSRFEWGSPGGRPAKHSRRHIATGAQQVNVERIPGS